MQAASGNWAPFLDQYLRPCWWEVVVACQAKNIPLPDADDLYQELMLRLIRDSGFNHGIRTLMAQQNQDPNYRGNLPGRYLKYRELPLRSARFRNYLKRVIHNIVLESLRKARHRPMQLPEAELEALQPWMEESISRGLDRRWVAGCLAEAALQLRMECEAATTRGQRRQFLIFYLSTVESLTATEIARRVGVHRTTIAGPLRRARLRFVELLRRITGIDDLNELSALLAQSGSDLRGALARVYADYPP